MSTAKPPSSKHRCFARLFVRRHPHSKTLAGVFIRLRMLQAFFSTDLQAFQGVTYRDFPYAETVGTFLKVGVGVGFNVPFQRLHVHFHARFVSGRFRPDAISPTKEGAYVDFEKFGRLNLINKSRLRGWDDKLIEKTEIDSTGTKVVLYVLKSGGSGFTGVQVIDSTFLQKFPLRDTISVPISKLQFNYERNTIARLRYDINDGYPIDDRMLMLDDQVFEDFYDQLFERILASKQSRAK